MRNRLIINLLLVLFLIGLGAIVWLTQEQENKEKDRVTSLDIANINTIHIERQPAESLTLQRFHQHWNITQPFNAPALDGKVERLLKISQIIPPVTYPLDSSALKNFGLESPTASIRFNNEQLTVGKTESVQSRRYAHNAEQLFLLDDTFLHHLTAPVSAYIDTRLLPDDIQITALQTPLLHLQQGSDNTWQDMKNSSVELSSDAVQMLLDEWRFARAIKVNYSTDVITGQAIHITFGDKQTLHFNLILQQGNVILIAPHSNLAYTLSAAKFKKMTTLPVLSDNDA